MLGTAAKQRGKSVLISGASVAGPALAYWLTKYGFRPVIVERAPALRGGGPGVDLEGAAQNVTRIMGLEGAIRAAHTGELGCHVVDTSGQIRASFPVGTGASLTKDIEILRGDLARLFYDKVKHSTKFIFDDTIEALQDHGDRVTVSFARGANRDFDAVVGADGVRSRTRGLFLGAEDGCSDAEIIKPVGLYMTYFTIPKGGRDSQWAEWYTLPNARMMLLRPDNVGTTRVAVAFMTEGSRGYELLGQAEQKEAVARVFADAGGEAPRVMEGMMGSDEFYMDWLCQVRAPRWSKGLCAVVGDAAYCPTPLTGMGTSLAVLGAYVLAGELAKHPNTQQGLAAYEQMLRPYVQKAQQLMPGVPRLAYPKTALGVAVLNNVFSFVASSATLRGKLFGGPQVEAAVPSGGTMVADRFGFQLPDYSAYYVPE